MPVVIREHRVFHVPKDVYIAPSGSEGIQDQYEITLTSNNNLMKSYGEILEDLQRIQGLTFLMSITVTSLEKKYAWIRKFYKRHNR
jgi:hypothetical protein